MSVIALEQARPSKEAESAIEKQIREAYALVERSLGCVGGHVQAAIVMGIDHGDLNRALKRNGRYLTVDHLMRLGEALREHDPEAAQRITVALVAPMDLLVFTRTQMTATEMEDRLLAYMRRFPNGEQLIRDALGPFDPRVQTTAAERVHRLREFLRRFPCGETMLREALATPAPCTEEVGR